MIIWIFQSLVPRKHQPDYIIFSISHITSWIIFLVYVSTSIHFDIFVLVYSQENCDQRSINAEKAIGQSMGEDQRVIDQTQWQGSMNTNGGACQA